MKKIIKGIVYLAILAVCILIPKKVSAKDAEGDIVVIIDPGHGGRDGGAVPNGIKEKDVNWNIAVSFKAELQTYEGVKVYLTKGFGEWYSNTGRGRFGKILGADIFISCHNNSGTNTDARGAMVFGTVNSQYSEQMKKLGNIILRNLSEIGIPNSGYRQRGSTDNPAVDFYTALDEATKSGIPSMIIEHCYLSNPSDSAFIANLDNQYRCGVADAKAVAEYYGLKKRTVNAGSNVNLIRTYSAQFNGTGTFKSSDENIVYVSSTGLMTAKSEGSATITCVAADGSESQIVVTVPKVVQVGVAAGINPTFFDSQASAEKYEKDTVMVKAIYSDGSAAQVNGATFGNMIPSSTEKGAIDIPVSYGGYSNYLRIYNYGMAGSYQKDNYKPLEANKDILLIPVTYEKPSVPETEATANPPTEAPTTEAPTTEAPTTEAPTTEAPTTEAPTTEAPTTEDHTMETTENVTEPSEKETDNTTVQVSEDDGEENTGMNAIKILVIVLIVICLVGIVVCSVIMFKSKKSK